MQLYLIRHGETLVNKNNKVHQAPDTPLSKTGLRQAHLLGRYLKKYSLDRIITSSLPRAIATTKIINQYLKLPSEISDFLVERRNPSVLFGRRYDDPLAIKVKKIIAENHSKPNYRYSDEETFFDLRLRMLQLLKSLKKYQNQKLVLVSHGHILVFFIGILTSGTDFSPDDYQKLDKEIHLENASITICEKTLSNEWKFPVFNFYHYLSYQIQPEIQAS